VLLSSRHSSGSRPRPTVLTERIGENGVTWKLVTYSSRAGPCVDILGFSAEGTALGGPGGCGPALTPELGSRLTPEAPKVLAQGQVLVGAVGTGTTFALVGGTASCASCVLTVSWSDGATTTDRATGGLFLSFRELG